MSPKSKSANNGELSIKFLNRTLSLQLTTFEAQILSYGYFPQDKTEDYQNCSVLSCVQHLCTHMSISDSWLWSRHALGHAIIFSSCHFFFLRSFFVLFMFRFSLDLALLFVYFLPFFFLCCLLLLCYF